MNRIIFSIIQNLTKFNQNCTHNNISPALETAYCPDCGKLINNEWFITRCACCGNKLVSKIYNNEVIPQSMYCQNCGSNEYHVEKIEKINFIDINYAVLIKKEVDIEDKVRVTQCWQERSNEKQKLLTLFQ